jgi:VanZ family protein
MIDMLSKKMLRFALCLWFGLIWVLSSIPGDSLPTIDAFNVDKLAHVTIYLIMSVLIFLNYNKGMFKNLTRHDVLLIFILLASLDEAHQHFIKFRAVSVLDLSADFFGLFLGYFAVNPFAKKYDRIH